MKDSNINLAINRELSKDYVEAVKFYSLELEENTIPSENTYVNFAFLCWQVAWDYGFTHYYKISMDFRNEAVKNYPVIIKRGLIQFPNSMELKFWERYFRHISYQEEFTELDCLKILNSNKKEGNVVPYFFLYVLNENKYKEKRDELLKMCTELPTAKNLYIKSIIE